MKRKYKFTLILFLIVLGNDLVIEYVEGIYYPDNPILLFLFWVVNMPGYIVYILLTGDMHGSIPGPIGTVGRVLVTVISSTIIWYFVIKVFIRLLNRWKKWRIS